jgi:hypothetical protein
MDSEPMYEWQYLSAMVLRGGLILSLISFILACTCKKATFHQYFSAINNFLGSQLSFQSLIVSHLRANS